MSHQSRMRKKIAKPDNPYTPDQSAPDANKWLKMIDAVERCAAEMELLMGKYGGEVFGVANTVFHENMPGKIMQAVERYRYLNTKIKEQGKAIKLFRP